MSQITTQKRVLMFVFDGGSGIGHLRRMSRIAESLQGAFACLLITGHRAEATWFIPLQCEYVHLPSWDSLIPDKSEYWGRRPFLQMTIQEAISFRGKLQRGVIEAFRPDLLLVEHLPLGAFGELEHVIPDYSCPKYLITRGVLNESRDGQELVLGPRALKMLGEHYRRVFVACDQRVLDFTKEYRMPPAIADKVVHVGYVAAAMSEVNIRSIRSARGLGANDIWVVASAGGGQFGESLIEACLAAASKNPTVHFDIVVGPRARSKYVSQSNTEPAASRLRVHTGLSDLSDLHAAADVVVCSGGYNSIIEALQGNAHVLCFPTWNNAHDEQYRHAASLHAFANVKVSLDLHTLPKMLENVLEERRKGSVTDRRRDLSFRGAQQIRDLLAEDCHTAVLP